MDFSVNAFTSNPITSDRKFDFEFKQNDDKQEIINFASSDNDEYTADVIDYDDAYDNYGEILDEDCYEADVCDVSDEDMAICAELFDIAESY